MTGQEFCDWQDRMKLNDVKTAKALALSRNTVAKYKIEGAPLHVALACAALVRGIAPWPD